MLDELAETYPRLKHVVEMKYFGGFSDQEIAEALDVTDRTVRRDWERARMLLSVTLKKVIVRPSHTSGFQCQCATPP